MTRLMLISAMAIVLGGAKCATSSVSSGSCQTYGTCGPSGTGPTLDPMVLATVDKGSCVDLRVPFTCSVGTALRRPDEACLFRAVAERPLTVVGDDVRVDLGNTGVGEIRVCAAANAQGLCEGITLEQVLLNSINSVSFTNAPVGKIYVRDPNPRVICPPQS